VEVPSLTLMWSVSHFCHCWMPSPLQAHWGRWCHTCLLWPACLCTVHVGMCHNPTLLSSGHPVPFVMCLFFFFSCFFIIQGFFSFFPGWGSVCPGNYADLSLGVPCATYLLTWWSPKQVRSWHLVAQETSWFLHIMWHGDAMCRLGCGGVKSFASS
jgi:hypothetical protein